MSEKFYKYKPFILVNPHDSPVSGILIPFTNDQNTDNIHNYMTIQSLNMLIMYLFT